MATFCLGKVTSIWRYYTQILRKYPLQCQAVNTSVLMATGDFLAQFFIEKRMTWKEYDKSRTLRYLTVGLFVLGPSMHIWYTSLDRIIKRRTTLKVAVKKMLMDQGLYLPPYIATFIVVMSKLRFESNSEVKTKLYRDFKPILLASYQLWPLVQIGNFYFVPLQHRILVMNLVGLMWNTYIAWKAEIEQKEVSSNNMKLYSVETVPESGESKRDCSTLSGCYDCFLNTNYQPKLGWLLSDEWKYVTKP